MVSRSRGMARYPVSQGRSAPWDRSSASTPSSPIRRPDPGHPLVAPLGGRLAEALHQTGAPAAMVARCPADDSAAGDEASAASRAW